MHGAMYGQRLEGQAALDLLMEVVERLGGAEDEKAVAALVRTAARRLTGADGVSVVLRVGDRVHYIDEDAVGPLWKGQNFPIEACISGWAMLNRQTAVISDIYGDPRIPLAAYKSTFVKSLVMAPVGMPEPFASIGAYWATKRRPEDSEVHALETVARAASVAMENVRLRRALGAALHRAESAERAQGVFLAQMSRNIRVPLAGMASLAELLERVQTNPKDRQLANSLKTSAEDVERLVRDVLDYAEIEGAQRSRFPAPFHLEAAVRVGAAPHVTEATRRGLEFSIEVEPEAAEVFVGDGAHVQKMVDLLVAYAVKNTVQGAVRVRIAESERMSVRSMFELSVKACGPCFAAAAERYAQGLPADSAGLDLAVAEALARAMGGALTMHATADDGRVLVRFPLEMPMDEVTERRLMRAVG